MLLQDAVHVSISTPGCIHFCRSNCISWSIRKVFLYGRLSGIVLPPSNPAWARTYRYALSRPTLPPGILLCSNSPAKCGTREGAHHATHATQSNQAAKLGI